MNARALARVTELLGAASRQCRSGGAWVCGESARAEQAGRAPAAAARFCTEIVRAELAGRTPAAAPRLYIEAVHAESVGRAPAAAARFCTRAVCAGPAGTCSSAAWRAETTTSGSLGSRGGPFSGPWEHLRRRLQVEHSLCRPFVRAGHGAASEVVQEYERGDKFTDYPRDQPQGLLVAATTASDGSNLEEWEDKELLDDGGGSDDKGWGSAEPSEIPEFEDWQLQRGRKREEERYMSMPPDTLAEPTLPAVPSDYMMPIKAYYIARSINSKELMRKVYPEYSTKHVRNNVAFRFPDRPEELPPTGMKPGLPHVPDRWMVAFDFGAVVFFNFEDSEIHAELEKARYYADNAFKKDQAKLEDFAMIVRPTLQGWSIGGPDHVLVKKADENNVRIVASVIAQSVALDHYISQVDSMLATFGEINAEMERTGNFAIKRRKLFQLVATINTTLSDVMIKLELLNRQETAWKYAQYGKIWEFLRDDFDITARFEGLNFKLNVIQQNVKFFLGVLQNRKSDLLEWIIILLIAGEICLGLYEIFHRV